MRGKVNQDIRGRVLIVDDEAAARQALGAVLEDEFDVEAADIVDGAKRLLTSRVFHLVVSDFALSGGSGFDVLAWAKRHQPNASGLVWTARADIAAGRASDDVHVLPRSASPEAVLIEVRRGVQLALLRARLDAARALRWRWGSEPGFP